MAVIVLYVAVITAMGVVALRRRWASAPEATVMPGPPSPTHSPVVTVSLPTSTPFITPTRLPSPSADATVASHQGSHDADIAPGPTPDGTPRSIRLPILMYHYVSAPLPDADIFRRDLSVHPGAFRKQMEYMYSHGYVTVSLYDLVYALTRGLPLPERAVVLTFDDGYADAYTNVYPVLREYGFTATFFVITGFLDTARPGYITWDQAREMLEGGMDIEPHSKSHPDLSELDYDALVYQIVGSIESVEANTGHRPRFFAYPSGRYDDRVSEVLRMAGIWGAVTTHNGTRHSSDELLALSRVRIHGDTGIETFAALLDWDGDVE